MDTSVIALALVLLACLAGPALPVLLRLIGWPALAAIGLVIACAALPVALYRSAMAEYVGIAAAQPVLYSYTLVLVCWLVTMPLWVRSVAGVWWRWLPFVIYCAVLWLTVWPRTSLTLSGLMQYALAPVAWTLGVAVARQVRRSASHVLSLTISAVVLVQFVVTALQAAGVIAGRTDAQAGLLEGRYAGLLDHPNNLGKVIFLLIAVQAALLPSLVRGVRRAAVVTLVLGGVTAAFTGGRAVLAAIAVGVTIWIVFSGNRVSTTSRVVRGILALIAVAASFLGVVLTRLEEDPAGGARVELEHLALEILSTVLPWGVGPNGYVEYVGVLDPLTASGVPVHNGLLLMAVEIGPLGTALFWMPFVVAILVAAASVARGARQPGCVALVAVTPGLLVVLLTGWGAVAGFVLPLLAFAIGLLSTRSSDDISDISLDIELDTSPRVANSIRR